MLSHAKVEPSFLGILRGQRARARGKVSAKLSSPREGGRILKLRATRAGEVSSSQVKLPKLTTKLPPSGEGGIEKQSIKINPGRTSRELSLLAQERLILRHYKKARAIGDDRRPLQRGSFLGYVSRAKANARPRVRGNFS